MRSIIGLVAAALLLSACSGPSASLPEASPPASTGAPAQSVSPSVPTADSFISDVYGYRAAVPSSWTVSPATVPWDGGDIDHTADYADRLTDEAGNEYFVLGGPSNASLAQAVDDHLTWLEENRGCPGPSIRTEAILDGVAAERMAIHCPEGVFGPTLVSKVIAVRDGGVVIVSSFSPDDGSDVFAPFDALVSSIRWIDSRPTRS